MLVWANRLHRGDLFVDVGANVGSYSVYAAELGASIIAIEANPDLVSRLRENLAVNDIAGEVHQLALADHTGTVRFDTSGDAIGHISEQGTEVPCDTLDNVLDGRRAAGVKIDVEGAERLVLMGAAETLADHRVGCLQLEWNARSRDLLGESREPVCELLWKHGYVLHRALPTGDLVAVEGVPAEVGDIFALPRGTSRSG
jgi:FkbM family methyltransferase